MTANLCYIRITVYIIFCCSIMEYLSDRALLVSAAQDSADETLTADEIQQLCAKPDYFDMPATAMSAEALCLAVYTNKDALRAALSVETRSLLAAVAGQGKHLYLFSIIYMR